MALINMMKPKPKIEARNVVAAEAPEPYYDKYPYGLKLDLGTAEMDKLGDSVNEFRVGDEVTVTAKATIERLSQEEHMDEMTGKMKMCQNMCLQITDLGLGKGEPQKQGTTLGALKGKLGRNNGY